MRVKSENEMFKRTIMEKEKEQRKEYRKMREAIKKKEQQIEKQVQRKLTSGGSKMMYNFSKMIDVYNRCNGGGWKG